jgi:hypothetical protein
MPKKGRRGSKRLAKKTQKMMKSSCMWGGDSAVTGLAGSGATGYGAAIYGEANAQTNNGFGSNNIKMNDPAVAWKGGKRGGSMLGAAVVPAALLAANQLYKPSRALKNLTYGRKKGFRKTMKKMMAKRRR